MTNPITDKYTITTKLESIDQGTIFDRDITQYLEQNYGVLFGREKSHELSVPEEFQFVSRNQGLIDIHANDVEKEASLIYYEASDKGSLLLSRDGARYTRKGDISTLLNPGYEGDHAEFLIAPANVKKDINFYNRIKHCDEMQVKHDFKQLELASGRHFPLYLRIDINTKL